jgi:hypothetical protein
MELYKVIKEYETSAAVIQHCDDFIVRIGIKTGAEVDVEALKSLYLALDKIEEGEKYAYIYNTADGTSTLTFEARKFASQHNEYYKKACVAIVIQSLPQRIVGNFYLRTVKQTVPYKLFNSLKEAEKWCSKQIEKNQKGKFLKVF